MTIHSLLHKIYIYALGLIRISIGWIASCIVACVSITFGLSIAVFTNMLIKGDNLSDFSVIEFLTIHFIIFMVTMMFIVYYTILPSIAVIIWAELTKQRKWHVYSIAGSLIALCIIIYKQRKFLDFGLGYLFLILLITVSSGFLAGYIYWLCSGRFAGQMFKPNNEKHLP